MKGQELFLLPPEESALLTQIKQHFQQLPECERLAFYQWVRVRLFDDAYRKQKIPSALRWKIMRRDGMRCVYCGSAVDLTIDHKTPEILGGTLDESNLVTACRSCNSEKGTSEFRQFKTEAVLRMFHAWLDSEFPEREERVWVLGLLMDHIEFLKAVPE